MIKGQVHDKFKLFAGKLAADNTIGELANEVAAFANQAHVAAKSIGIVSGADGKILVTLGYRDDGAPYSIKLHSVSLGKYDAATADFGALEKSMGVAAGKYADIICHELYVTPQHDFMMIVMTHE